jgi:hypothetical protein
LEKDHDDIPPKSLFWLFLKSGGWGVFLAVVILAGSIITGFVKSNMANVFERDGLIVNATISQLYKRVEHDSNGSKTYYYATYDFEYHSKASNLDKTVSKRQLITKKQHAKLNKGQSVQVRYLPVDPENFESPIGQTKADAATALWVTIVVGSIALGFLWFCGLASVQITIARRDGRALKAIITEITPTLLEYNDQPRHRLVWKDELGVYGQSWMAKQSDLACYKVGDEITIFLHKGKKYWRGDIGGRTMRKTPIPKTK